MINANKVYVVRPLYGRTEAFVNRNYADHYARLCRLFGYTVSFETYECDTTNFYFMSDLYPYAVVTWKPEENEFKLAWKNNPVPDDPDAGSICVSSERREFKDLFLKGDDSGLKRLVLDRSKGDNHEDPVS